MPASLRALPCTALLCLALLAGCSDSDASSSPDPGPSTPSSTSTSSAAPSEPSASTSSAAPALSPEETVKAWVAARNDLLKTGDGELVGSLSSTSCKTCRDLNAGISDIYAAGGRFSTPGWRVVGAKRAPDFERSRKVSSAIIFSAGTIQESASSKPRSFERERNFLDFTLVRQTGRWLVAEVVFLS